MKQDLPGFDTLLRIARDDPQQLEQLRQQLAESTIASAPKNLRPRLRGLQFQINLCRRRAKTPLSACMQLSRMMQESFEELRLALNHPPAAATPPRQSAKIISFPSRFPSR